MQPELTTPSHPGGDLASPPALSDASGGTAGPTLAHDVKFVPSGVVMAGGLVHRRSTGLVARIGSVEWQVLCHFDGCGIELVRQRVEQECGLRLTPTELDTFVRQACTIGLLERAGGEPISGSRWRGLSWSVSLWNPERVFAWCAPRASLLFHPATIGIGVLITVIAAVSLARTPSTISAPHVAFWPQLAIFLVLLNIVSIVHECAHGLTLHRFGGCARDIGVRFVLGWPCWYCDITESYLLPRLGQRIAVILAGPVVQAVVCALLVLVARGAEPHIVALRRAAAVLGAFSAVNFFPLIRSDGYYLLTELAGLPNLRTHAWAWLSSSRARRRLRERLPRVRRLAIVAYATASLGFLVLVIGQAIAHIGRVVTGARPLSIRTVIATVSIATLLAAVGKRRSLTS